MMKAEVKLQIRPVERGVAMHRIRFEVRPAPAETRWRALWDWLLKPPDNEEDAVPLQEFPRPCPPPRIGEEDV